jgi:hypothetical protein
MQDVLPAKGAWTRLFGRARSDKSAPTGNTTASEGPVGLCPSLAERLLLVRPPIFAGRIARASSLAFRTSTARALGSDASIRHARSPQAAQPTFNARHPLHASSRRERRA